MEKLEPSLPAGIENITDALDNRLTVLQKLNTKLSYDPTILLLGIIQENWKHMFTKQNKMYTNTFNRINYSWYPKSGNKCLLTEWINKMWYIHTMEYYSVIKRNEVLGVPLRNSRLRIWHCHCSDPGSIPDLGNFHMPQVQPKK